ncbi:MAG: ATP-binding cassette domain-containing protein [Planctomycetaceae bacterium]|nr:ATP-binding cassette domain-containing protein [Planctomycetaceae bacterium]
MTSNRVADAQWARQRAQMAADLAEVKDLAPLAARADEIDRLVDDLDEQLRRAERAAVIVLVGPTGAGKSTLLNALLGHGVATEGEMRPTTRAPVVHAPHDADLAALLEGLPGRAPTVVRYEPTAKGPFAGQVLVDAPDLNSAEREHRAVTRALAEHADVLLVLVKAESVVEESTLSFLDEFRGRREVLAVLGRADELSAANRASVERQWRDVVGKRLGLFDVPVLSVSAKLAKLGQGGADFARLGTEIERLADGSRLEGVRRHNATGAAAQLARVVAEAAPGLSAELRTHADGIETGLSALAEAAARELEVRAELRLAPVARALASESGERWNGPVGWCLRAGGASTLGLGAAALLVRRNPLLAAGAAVGGTVAGRAKEIFDERGLADTSGLLPERSAFQDLWQHHLVGARLGAGRLATGPLALARSLEPPSAEELLGQLEERAAEAWSRLVARDLPQAAQAAFPLPLRLTLDFAPYALIAWMVWCAARGFLSGQYVGLDFLLNGFFLLAAMLFLLRLAVGRWFLFRARRLIRGATTRAKDGLESAALKAAAPSAAGARHAAEALDRLTQLDAHFGQPLGTGAAAHGASR